MTFNEYLNSVRVKKAEEYLLDVDMPVTEIAYMSGFNSIQTFNRVFKKAKAVHLPSIGKEGVDKEIAIFDK